MMLKIEACKTLIFATRHERKSIFTRFKGPENYRKPSKYDAKLMLKQIGKSIPKLLPKSRNMRPKIDLESPLGSNFSILEAFGAMQKYDEFLMRFWRPKN